MGDALRPLGQRNRYPARRNLTMMLSPTDFKTWKRLDDHPIFGAGKANISDWSHDPDQYGRLENFGQFKPEWYAHVDPELPVEQQRQIATQNLRNLADACDKVIETYGDVTYELVVLDDFTVFVWLKNETISISIYPLQFDDEFKLMLFLDAPVLAEEIRCRDSEHLVHSIKREIAG